jgi:hypothetical protein
MAVMGWISDLAAMREHGTRVIRTGCGCGCWGDVDLGTMAQQLRGWDMTLWDCRPPCPLCGELQHFMASPGASMPFRPMISAVPDSVLPLPAQAWMPGWTGRR